MTDVLTSLFSLYASALDRERKQEHEDAPDAAIGWASPALLTLTTRRVCVAVLYHCESIDSRQNPLGLLDRVDERLAARGDERDLLGVDRAS
jgi:hypothetical protein